MKITRLKEIIKEEIKHFNENSTHYYHPGDPGEGRSDKVNSHNSEDPKNDETIVVAHNVMLYPHDWGFDDEDFGDEDFFNELSKLNIDEWGYNNKSWEAGDEVEFNAKGRMKDFWKLFNLLYPNQPEVVAELFELEFYDTNKNSDGFKAFDNRDQFGNKKTFWGM
jgi:hypothetical protein